MSFCVKMSAGFDDTWDFASGFSNCSGLELTLPRNDFEVEFPPPKRLWVLEDVWSSWCW